MFLVNRWISHNADRNRQTEMNKIGLCFAVCKCQLDCSHAEDDGQNNAADERNPDPKEPPASADPDN